MEDKWFIYWHKSRVLFHRSWTGFCIYVVYFSAYGDAYRMTAAEVNRDPEQYGQSCDEQDAEMISYLVDLLLLRRGAAFPFDEPTFDRTFLQDWWAVDRAMLGKHLGDAPSSWGSSRCMPAIPEKTAREA